MAIQYYDQALALDPTFAPALASRASALLLITESPDTVAMARTAIAKALEQDPMSGEVHAQYGKLLFETDWDWPGAERELERAIELNPNDADAHHEYAHLLVALGRMKEAREQSDVMAALDPLAPATPHHQAWMAYAKGDFAGARNEERKALALDHSYEASFVLLVDVEQAARNWSAFPPLLEQMKAVGIPVDPELPRLVDAAGHGRTQDAIQTIREMGSSRDPYTWAFTELAAWSMTVSRRDEAFAWLDSARVHRDYNLLFINHDPNFASLKSDPRYAAIRGAMKLPK